MPQPVTMDDLDLMHNPDPVCPHCGHVATDTCDWDDRQETECAACDEPYIAVGETVRYWTTRKCEGGKQ
jgi:hypothetical protein